MSTMQRTGTNMSSDKTKKKILVIGSVPPPIGGATIYFQTLLRTEVATKFDVIFLDIRFSTSISEYGQFSLSKTILLVKYILRLFYILISNRIDLVYSAIQFNKAAYIKDVSLAAICKLFGKRVVGCIVGIGLTELYDRSGWPMKWCIRRSVGFYYSFTTPSITMYERYFPSFLMPVKKALSVPYGIFTDASGIIPKLHKESEQIQVIYYSHYIKSKGLDDLVAAIPLILKENPNVTFLFVGAWDTESHRESVMGFVESAGIGKFVRFLGVLTGDDKCSHLERSDIFVLPTYFEFEGLPLSILEAMSFGCAVIATNHAAISSVVEDGVNGLICKPNNPQDLASKILLLLNDRQNLLRIQTNNINKFQDFFTAERFGERLSHELKLLCG